jgi:hypothetical protein
MGDNEQKRWKLMWFCLLGVDAGPYAQTFPKVSASNSLVRFPEEFKPLPRGKNRNNTFSTNLNLFFSSLETRRQDLGWLFTVRHGATVFDKNHSKLNGELITWK